MSVFFKRHRLRFFFIFFLVITANILNLAFPYTLKIILDEVLGAKDRTLLVLALFSLGVISLLKGITGYFRSYCSMSFAECVVADLRATLHRHILSLPVTQIENNRCGDLIARLIGDIESIRRFLFSGVLEGLNSFFTVFFMLGILFWLEANLAILTLGTFFLWGFWLAKGSHRLKSQHGELRSRYGDLSAKLAEVFRGMRTIHAFNRASEEHRRFLGDQGEISRFSLKTFKTDTILWTSVDFLTSLGLIATLGFGAHLVISGKISAGTLMAFYVGSGLLFLPLVRLSTIHNSYQEAAASLERVREILAEKTHDGSTGKTMPLLGSVKGDVKFENVQFAYDGGSQILSGVHLTVKAGERVALIGPSGSGKTTMMALLAGFLRPSSGRILVDGYDLKQVETESYRAQIGIVLQNDFLFDETVKKNISYGAAHATDEAVFSASRDAYAHDFIMNLPNQYETPVGEMGLKLSYGQRQRIALARALLKNPSILILDEATSAVDSATDEGILSAIQKRKSCTTFIIAHRLSTVKLADRIVVLDSGRIVSQGKHGELIKKCAVYRRLHEQQLQKELITETL